MRRIFKKSNIFSFILGAIIFGGIGTVAAATILAKDVSYTPNDTAWKKANGEDITNIKDAIDDLYEKSNTNKNIITKYSKTGTSQRYGDGITFDISEYENYKNITIDNIFVKLERVSFNQTQKSDACGHLTFTYSYDATSGIIKVTFGGSMSHYSWKDPIPSAEILIIDNKN